MSNHRNKRWDAPKAEHPGKFDTRWVTTPDAIDDNMVDWAEKAGKYLTSCKLSTSSLRRFFGEIRRIEADFEKFKSDVPMLRARLAYDAGRRGKDGMKEFGELVKPGIIVIDKQRDNFLRFIKIIEAIVAFHKANGGKEN